MVGKRPALFLGRRPFAPSPLESGCGGTKKKKPKKQTRNETSATQNQSDRDAARFMQMSPPRKTGGAPFVNSRLTRVAFFVVAVVAVAVVAVVVVVVNLRPPIISGPS